MTLTSHTLSQSHSADLERSSESAQARNMVSDRIIDNLLYTDKASDSVKGVTMSHGPEKRIIGVHIW